MSELGDQMNDPRSIEEAMDLLRKLLGAPPVQPHHIQSPESFFDMEEELDLEEGEEQQRNTTA